MNMLNNYIPKEYLALKINYIRLILQKLPKVKLRKISPSDPTIRVVVGNHIYRSSSPKGMNYLNILQKRERLESELQFYEALWNNNFSSAVPSDIMPFRAQRFLFTDYDKKVLLNKTFFDSLINDSNTSYEKPNNHVFDGIKYRSEAEKEIAIFYTEMGIPFKYEPSIYIKGVTKPIYTDFILYIEEIDNCKFHEHLGINNSVDYLRDTKIKYSNYTGAGLIPDLDILFTYSTDDTTFDPRFLSAKLNAAVYGTVSINKPSSNRLVS